MYLKELKSAFLQLLTLLRIIFAMQRKTGRNVLQKSAKYFKMAATFYCFINSRRNIVQYKKIVLNLFFAREKITFNFF